jgi:hypothetical protein
VNVAAHAIWEMWEHYADKFLGTYLQPGGMGEASANMAWSFLGAALGIALVWWWRRRRLLEAYAVASLAALLSRVRGAPAPA